MAQQMTNGFVQIALILGAWNVSDYGVALVQQIWPGG
jgi:hypothetical protein